MKPQRWFGSWFPLLAFSFLTGALLTSCLTGGHTTSQGTGKKVLVLGMDGMDPQLLQRFMDEGKLPNFKRLAEQGDFRPLTTSNPPQSPVAWSNFITGMNPGGHGIFDFIHRDPNTMLPYLSTSRVEPPQRTLNLGSWVLPLSSGKVSLLRQGKAFWEILAEHGTPATVYRVPANFPPVESPARTFAGMGTPDILGTYGTFSFYTDDPPDNAESISGGRIYPVRVENFRVAAQLVGPENTFRKQGGAATVDFTVWVDPVEPVAKIAVQEHEFLLQVGEWSDWVQVEFELIPYLASATGICKFYLKQTQPHFQLYVTPINLDPSAPALPLSTPEDYAQELAEQVGFFYTQGIAEDTKALSGGILTQDEFLQQARMVLADQRKVFDLEWARFQEGLLFFYFSSLDQNAHMLWRFMDERHPNYDPQLADKYAGVLEKLYQEMDEVVGTVLEKVDENTTLLILSDHGFAPFYRSFNLNTWLLDNGYVFLQDASQREQTEFLLNVEWSRTRAYGLGLNALYLNLRGRERYGTVMPGVEAEQLLDEIIRKLLSVTDPETGRPVMTRVDRATEVYTGPYVTEAPDLLVGYNRGYRAGWDTILGKFPRAVLEDNRNEWSGDHCMDFRLVPGVLLSNKKLRAAAPALTDLAPTILAEFGIEKTEEMVGQSVFLGEPAAAGDN